MELQIRSMCKKEVSMEREDHIDAALIDLGAVAEETKGSNVIMDDRHGGQLPGLGLSDD